MVCALSERRKGLKEITAFLAMFNLAATESKFDLVKKNIRVSHSVPLGIYFIYQRCNFCHECHGDQLGHNGPRVHMFNFREIFTKMSLLMSIYMLTVKPLLDLTGIYSWWLWVFFRLLVIWFSVFIFFLLVCKCVTVHKRRPRHNTGLMYRQSKRIKLRPS